LDLKAGCLQRIDKLWFVEAVRLRMIHESADDWMGDVSTEDFFAIEPSPRFQYPMNLAKRGSPVDDMVDCTEVENGVIVRIRHRYMPDVSNPEAQLAAMLGLPQSNPRNHFRIQVKCINAGGTKAAEQKIDAKTRAAADFQYPLPLCGTTHFKQTRCFKMALQECANGAEDEKALNKIKPHVTYCLILFSFENGIIPHIPESVSGESLEKMPDHLRRIEIEQWIIVRKTGGKIRTGPDVSPIFDLAQDDNAVVPTFIPTPDRYGTAMGTGVDGFAGARVGIDPEADRIGHGQIGSFAFSVHRTTPINAYVVIIQPMHDKYGQGFFGFGNAPWWCIRSWPTTDTGRNRGGRSKHLGAFGGESIGQHTTVGKPNHVNSLPVYG
jgi:hypothetical protein